MKFCIIYSHERLGYVGQEYEEPYRYSEWTGGGGCFNLAFLDKEELFVEEGHKKITIFEDEDKAKHWIKTSGFEESLLEVVFLKDL